MAAETQSVDVLDRYSALDDSRQRTKGVYAPPEILLLVLCGGMAGAALIAKAARDHWPIENRLPWIMDVVFHDDLSRHGTHHGPQNMALIRQTALNLITNAKGTMSFETAPKAAGGSDDFLDHAIKQIEFTPLSKPSPDCPAFCGCCDEAIEAMDRAISLSPRDPHMGVWIAQQSAAMFVVQRYDEGASYGRRAVQEAPEFMGAHRVYAANLVELGRMDEARRQVAEMLRIFPEITVARTRASVPFRDDRALERYCAALARAGLPQ